MTTPKKKLITLALSTAIIATAGGFASYHTLANNLSKEEKIKALDKQLAQKEAEVDTIPLENVQERYEKGLEIKEMSWKIGELKQDMPLTIDELDSQLKGHIAGLDILIELQQRNGEDAATMEKTIQKKELFQQLHKDFKEKRKASKEVEKQMKKL